MQDENRYSAGRGAHLTLKRAEKARAIVNKLPSNWSMANILQITDLDSNLLNL